MSIDVAALSLERNHRPILNHIGFHLPEGQIMAVIGPNGAGKSSLLQCLSGDWRGTGRIAYNGRTLEHWRGIERARSLAVLPQSSHLDFAFNVEDVVAFGRSPHNSGRRIDQTVIAAALRAVDMTHLAKRPYPSLSGGEKQRAQLARVLAQIWRADDSPQRYLLLDEPLNALDIAHKMQLMRTLKALSEQGCTTVAVMHDFSFAMQLADHILALGGGRIYDTGPTEAVMTPGLFKNLFAVEASVIDHPQTGRPTVVI